MALLKDNDPLVRIEAAKILAELGELEPRSTAAIPVLTELLGDKDARTRAEVSRLLLFFDPEAAKVVVPVLTELLTCKDREVCRAAACTLGEIGANAKAAIPALTELVNNEAHNDRLRRQALCSLQDIGPPAVPALVELL